MKRLFVTLLTLSTLLLSGPHADTLEFAMPNLAGGSSSTAKIDSFVYSGQSATVNGVSVRYVGYVADVGMIHCLVPPGEPDSITWFLDVDAALVNKSGGAAWQIGDYWLWQNGPFDDTKTHHNGFTTLFDGDVVEMELRFAWNYDWQWGPDPCSLLTEGYGELSSVTVILDVTYQIPVKSTTWGRIKNLY